MIDKLVGAKRRLVLLIGVVLIAGFLATSLASYFVSVASVREGIVESGLPLTADNIYSEIQRDLLRPIFISSMMAHDTFLRDWVINGEQDTGQVAKYLGEIKSKYDTVSSFFISDATRTYYFPDGVLKKMSPDDWRDVWYFRVRDMKEPYEINVDPDFANRDTMTIFINYRLLDYGGHFLGATGVGLTVTSLRKQVDVYRDRFGRDVYFVDTAGKVVLAGVTASVGDSILKRAGLDAIAPDILAGHDGSFQYRNGGHTILLNTRFIPELGWHVFVEQDETGAIAAIRKALTINLLICLVITAVVVAAISVTITRFQQRIEQLAVTDKLTGLLNRRVRAGAERNAAKPAAAVSGLVRHRQLQGHQRPVRPSRRRCGDPCGRRRSPTRVAGFGRDLPLGWRRIPRAAQRLRARGCVPARREDRRESGSDAVRLQQRADPDHGQPRRGPAAAGRGGRPPDRPGRRRTLRGQEPRPATRGSSFLIGAS